jgi:hypothetical protein
MEGVHRTEMALYSLNLLTRLSPQNDGCKVSRNEKTQFNASFFDEGTFNYHYIGVTGLTFIGNFNFSFLSFY